MVLVADAEGVCVLWRHDPYNFTYYHSTVVFVFFDCSSEYKLNSYYTTKLTVP